MKPGALWPVAIVGMLAITVGANVYMLWATRDPTILAIEPDYYRKAVGWDSTMAQARREVAMGWKAEAAFGPLIAGKALLAVTLSDSAGEPVNEAAVGIEAINNVDATRHVPGVLVHSEPGRYEGMLALPRPGLWEVRVTARRDSLLFTQSLRVDVARGAAH